MVREIHERKNAMNVEKDFDVYLELSGYSRNEIISHRRNTDLVGARKFIADTLRQCGYSYPEIGFVMNRHHTAILHLCTKRPWKRWKKGGTYEY